MSKKKTQKYYGATARDCCVSGYNIQDIKLRVKEAKRCFDLALEVLDSGIIMYEDQAAIVGRAYIQLRDAKQDLKRAKGKRV